MLEPAPSLGTFVLEHPQNNDECMKEMQIFLSKLFRHLNLNLLLTKRGFKGLRLFLTIVIKKSIILFSNLCRYLN